VPHKASALALALKQVEMSYGKGSIMQLGKSKPLTNIDVISTGSISLDHALGIGGLPKGRSVLVTVKCLL
jgi:recombination protein RecA